MRETELSDEEILALRQSCMCSLKVDEPSGGGRATTIALDPEQATARAAAQGRHAAENAIRADECGLIFNDLDVTTSCTVAAEDSGSSLSGARDRAARVQICSADLSNPCSFILEGSNLRSHH